MGLIHLLCEYFRTRSCLARRLFICSVWYLPPLPLTYSALPALYPKVAVYFLRWAYSGRSSMARLIQFYPSVLQFCHGGVCVLCVQVRAGGWPACYVRPVIDVATVT